MGWKSTLEITRKEAVSLVHKRLLSLDELSDSELESLIEDLGYGDDTNLSHYGCNFSIID
jgi:hypothetical protein|tara:strand:- start:2839 stop:3018 length:180 start_codon:yes stop_codon:yes gene_type:complete